MSILYGIFPNLERLGGELLISLGQTLKMLAVSGSISFVLGIFFGVLLIVTRKGGLLQNRFIYTFLDKIIDVIRSIPFLILMVLLIPVSRALVGTGSGVTGSYVALIAGTVPFFSRQIESVLADLDSGLIEASEAMGFTPVEIIFGTGSYVALIAGTVPFFSRQIESVLADLDSGLIEASEAMGFTPVEIIFGVYLKESIPGITRVTMITFVSLIGITAMAGAIGAGGLGDFAIRYGYQMRYTDMSWVTVIIILIIISIIQFIGNFIIRKTTH